MGSAGTNQNQAPSEALYRVRTSAELGRYLVASRDIEPREVIIRESPFLSAPSDNGSQAPMCLGCCICMVDNEWSRCGQCYWPVCSLDCEQAPSHAQNECRHFRAQQVPYPPPYPKSILNKSIMILRALILKAERPAAWDQLLQMESHLELRKNKPNCISSDGRIIENLKTFFPAQDLDEEEVRRISGIIDVNAHVLPQRVNGADTAGVCHIFRKTSLLSHSCSPNAAWTTDPTCDSILVTRASVPIKAGDEIKVAYDVGELLFGTLRRLIPMEISGLFTCACARCSDPTELGTNLSTLICTACRIGRVLPLRPTDSFSDWLCSACPRVLNDEEVLDILEDLELQIGFPKFNVLFCAKPESVQFLESFIRANSGIRLHPNHYLIQEVRLRLVKQLSSRVQELSGDELETFVRASEDLMEVAKSIIPGFSEYRAILQFHLCQGFRELILRKKALEGHDLDLLPERLEKVSAEALLYFRENYGYDKYIIKLEEGSAKKST